MAEVLRYTINFKFRGNYKVVHKTFTEEEFDNYYNNCINQGQKLIGYTTKEIKDESKQ